MSDLLTIIQGDALERLREMPDASVQMCVTSPPYWNLRRYNAGPKEIGQEKTPELFIANLVAIFAEVKRVLKNDGTLWVVIGDSFAKDGIRCPGTEKNKAMRLGRRGAVGNLKPKDLIGIPWMLAFALRRDGWFLRSDIIWAKPNPMPESVTDRPTRSHEYIFLFSKKPRYYYNHEAVKDPPCGSSLQRIQQPNFANQHGGAKDYRNGTNGNRSMRKTLENWASNREPRDKQMGHSIRHQGFNDRWDQLSTEEQGAFGRNKRDVWNVAPANYNDAHFATFPPDLIKPCILAGSRPGDTVLDPFGGSGTTGMVAVELGRKAILIELNPNYCQMIRQRTDVTPGMQLA